MKLLDSDIYAINNKPYAVVELVNLVYQNRIRLQEHLMEVRGGIDKRLF